MNEFFAEYDRLQKTCSDEELESWLILQCQTYELEHPDDQKVIGALYNELGAFYKHRNRLDKSIEAFLKAKAALETLEKDANYATLINNLAGTYRQTGDFDEAIALFQESIKVYQDYPETPKELSSSAFNNLALVYLDTGKFREAADMLQAAYDAMKDIPDCYFEKATTNANMAVVYYKAGEMDLAAEKVQIADELYQSGHLEESQEYKAFLMLKEIVGKR